ncbi:head decoration protein [Endozoicomonas sp. Mp262]|uniref:head decoration protein n=1 Tax=Endozoicomonas sp. Mp262 TaxID=2919499 RepID=UPI0021DAE52C
MPVQTEPVHTGEFIVSEGNNSISRECVALVAELTLLPGTVLGKETATGTYGPLDLTADNGLQVAVGILWDHERTGSTGKEGVIIARLAEVDERLLIWPAAITEEQQAAAVEALKAVDIILRQGEQP